MRFVEFSDLEFDRHATRLGVAREYADGDTGAFIPSKTVDPASSAQTRDSLMPSGCPRIRRWRRQNRAGKRESSYINMRVLTRRVFHGPNVSDVSRPIIDQG
jgi:hypothetical protein